MGAGSHSGEPLPAHGRAPRDLAVGMLGLPGFESRCRRCQQCGLDHLQTRSVPKCPH